MMTRNMASQLIVMKWLGDFILFSRGRAWGGGEAKSIPPTHWMHRGHIGCIGGGGGGTLDVRGGGGGHNGCTGGILDAQGGTLDAQGGTLDAQGAHWMHRGHIGCMGVSQPYDDLI